MNLLYTRQYQEQIDMTLPYLDIPSVIALQVFLVLVLSFSSLHRILFSFSESLFFIGTLCD